MATSSQELVNTRKPESDAGIDVEDDEDDVSGLNTKTFRLQQNCTFLCLCVVYSITGTHFFHTSRFVPSIDQWRIKFFNTLPQSA